MRGKYIHELKGWPRLIWDRERLGELLAAVRHRQGRLIGHMEALGFPLRQEAVLETLTSDVLKSSEIEGERLDAEQVRSSIARRLGIDIGAMKRADRDVEGVVEMMLEATGRYAEPLTKERLFGWHASLFPGGRSGATKIRAGAWRDDAAGPMEVVSGAIGRERVHFRAPAAERLDAEMAAFLKWFNGEDGMDPVAKAGLAHLWFVTVHPFDDGNGRIARAIADLALARSEGSSQRFYSMSAQIRQERGDYYDVLERTQQGSLDVTVWMEWFLGCLGRAIEGAQTMLGAVLAKARFWESVRDVGLNDRQRLVLNRMLDGFEGKLTTSKYARLAKCSQDTALRDVTALAEYGVLVRSEEGGRSTSYGLGEKSKAGSFTLFINLRCQTGVFRRFQIIARPPDDYYGFTPVKGGSTKFSRHQSGQDHIRAVDGTLLGVTQDESSRPDQIEFPDTLWFVNLDGPKSLLPYDERAGDGVFEVAWDELKHEEYVYSVEVALGREFDIGAGNHGLGYLVQEKCYPVPVSVSRLSMRLQLVGAPRSLEHAGH